MVSGYYRESNAWFLEMGAIESKIKSPPKTPTTTGRGSGTRTSFPMKKVQPPNPKPVTVWPENSVRWQSLYDVYICHSEEEADCSYAMDMLSYLEQQPEKLRCFLPMRDMLAGSPLTSEMCSGLENSHCWVMLLTPHFLSDQWCRYQMHQFLTHAPCSNGRLIPVIIGLSFAQYPSEVKHMYAFKDTLNDKSVFIKVKDAILTYLKEMLTVTSDKIPAYAQNSKTPDRSRSPITSVENSQGDTSETQKSDTDTFKSSLVLQESSSNMASKTEMTEKTSDMEPGTQLTCESIREFSLRYLVSEETTSDISIRSCVTEQDAERNIRSSMIEQETTSVMATKSSVSREQTTSDTCLGPPLSQDTIKDGFSKIPLSQKISEFVIGSLEPEETTSDISRDVCTHCKCAKDSLSHETQIDTNDSGVCSMTKDLHTNCSNLHTTDGQTASKHLHSNYSDLYTSGVQTLSMHSHSECSDLYTSQLDEVSEQNELHSQVVSTDSHPLYSNIYTSVSD